MYKESNQEFLSKLKTTNPNFAKHMLEKNELIKAVAIANFGSVDLLEQPVCPKCEKPCTWDTGGTAYHLECGTRIIHPITMYQYLSENVKNLPPELMDLITFLMKPRNEIILDGGTSHKIETKENDNHVELPHIALDGTSKIRG